MWCNYKFTPQIVDHKIVDQLALIDFWSHLVAFQKIWSPFGHQLEPSDRQIEI